MRIRTVVIGTTLLLAMGLIFVASYHILTRDYQYQQLVQMGDRLQDEQLPFQATRAYDSAIRLDPENALAYFKRAEAQVEQKNLQAALDDLQIAARLSSDGLMASSRLADLCSELGRFEDAARHYRHVLAIDPNSPVVLYKLGLVYFRAGHEAEAIEALNRAASLREGF